MGCDKGVGGMGFRNLMDFNISLLAKQCWRLHADPRALWARVLKSLYFPNCQMLQAVRGSSLSWAWSSLLEGCNFLQKGLVWQIGLGVNVDLWKDNWIPRLPLMNLRHYDLHPEIFTPVVPIIDRASDSWNLEAISPSIPLEARHAVITTQFGSASDHNRKLWAHSSSDSRSISSLDRWIDGVFMDKDDHCDFGADFETTVSFLLWNIWKTRCNLVFNKAAFDPVQTASTAFWLAQEFLLIPQKLYKSLDSPILNPNGVVQYWINPKLGMIKINTDAAWNKDSAECGLAAVARNSLGKIVGGMHNYGYAISIMAAEALAIKFGLSLSSSLSLSSFQLESDSLVLISTLSNPLSTVDWTTARSIAWI
ncbi:hypothetical protein ACLB2K_004444 [Fragaria x ananassa]